jgi:hypothetical protein
MYKLLSRKSETSMSLGSSRQRWEDSIEIDFEEQDAFVCMGFIGRRKWFSGRLSRI